MNTSECQERAEGHLDHRRRSHQFITNHHLVGVGREKQRFLQNNLANFVGEGRNGVHIEVHNVFVSFRVILATIAMDAQVELSATQIKTLIEGGKQHVFAATQRINRHSQQAVVTTGIASHDGRVAIGARLVGADNLAFERIRQIDKFRFVEC